MAHAFHEYARDLTQADIHSDHGKDGGGSEDTPFATLLKHVHGMEIVVTDDIYQSMLKRKDQLRNKGLYLSMRESIFGFNTADAVTHVGTKGFIFLRPGVTPGTVAHEALHVLQVSRFPDNGDESWNYPLGFLTDAALKVYNEAMEKVAFDPTVTAAKTRAEFEVLFKQAVEYDLKAQKEAGLTEPGLMNLIQLLSQLQMLRPESSEEIA